MDIFNFPNTDLNTKVFFVNSGSWQTWVKPRNCKFIYMFVLGGGAGGGGGTSGSAGTTRAGGGGGGSSGTSRGFFPASFLPDILYVQVGAGGLGGGPNLSGSSGELSYVSIQPNTTTANVVMASGAVGPTGGSNTGTAGGAGTVFAQTAGFIGYLGNVLYFAGGNAGAGGNGAQGISITLQFVAGPGAGGGGVSSGNAGFAGGIPTTAGSVVPTFPASTSASVLPGGAFIGSLPSSNTSVSRPPFFTGGGGGAGVSTTGVSGFPGAYGSGGGGGGAGVTGGSGGNGGDGLVIIHSY